MNKLLAALALCACHHPAPPSASPENTVPDDLAMGYVLVSESAWLRSAPHDDAPGARAATFDRALEENVERVWVARMIADEGDWVEIETLTGIEAQPHCYGGVSGLDAFKLRLHVRRSDLVTVTEHELQLSYEDGSGVTLAAGVALQRAGDRYRIGVDEVDPVLPFDDDYGIGLSYLAPTGHYDDLDEDADVAPLAMPEGTFLVDGVEVHLPDVAPAEVDNEDPQHPLATVNLACSRYRGRIDTTMFGPGQMGRYNMVGSVGISDVPEITAGARLTWPDGSPAGESISDYQVYWSGDAKGCFRVPLHGLDTDEQGTEEWFLTLCADEDHWIAGYGAEALP